MCSERAKALCRQAGTRPAKATKHQTSGIRIAEGAQLHVRKSTVAELLKVASHYKHYAQRCLNGYSLCFGVLCVLQVSTATCADVDSATNGTTPFACPTGYVLKSNASSISNITNATCCVSIVGIINTIMFVHCGQ
jgi:hypothetical protein